MSDVVPVNELSMTVYHQWVDEGRPKVEQVKIDLLDLCRFLYPKREQFSQKRPGPDVITWKGFLGDIGLARSTAHDWLNRYDPETDAMIGSGTIQKRE